MAHLAQINIGKLRYPIDDPRIAEFVDNLDRINAIAEASLGFVWRLKDDSGNATGFSPFPDPLIIPNMSVWESVEALRDFAYRSADHVHFMRRRAEWFEKYPSNYLALWWIEEGHRPDLMEAKAKLEDLDKHGPSDRVFTFRELRNA